jgi:ABC-type branched-subunit amino acid transport system ATPase component
MTESAPQSAQLALQLHGLTRLFGGVAAVNDVSLQVPAGAALGIIGPNGAGKSTLVGLISGALAPSSGRIELFGHDVTRLPAEARTRLGIGRTHQIPRPFARMSVRENLQLAAWQVHAQASVQSVRQDCERILERTGLADVADRIAGELPLLRRKRLELARALALRPKLLLLDEIGAGLVEAEVQQLIALIQALRDEVQSVVLIEHVMEVITACCGECAVLAQGRLLLQGRTAEVLRDARVAAVYLGTGGGAAGAVARVEAAQSRAVAGAPLVTAIDAVAVAATDTELLLEVRDASVDYGGVHALRGVTLEVRAGQVVALLGANGAGKTTLARAVSGAVRLGGGEIRFAQQVISGLAAESIAARGIAHCLEGRHIFATLSVEENLLLAAPAVTRAERQRRVEQAYAMFPVLAERRDKPGTAMSGGQQQMLAIARALMAGPRLILFDEISLGLAPIVVDQLFEVLQRVRASGVAVLLVEQSVDRALAVADYGYVLAQGRLRLQGTPQQLANAAELRALYVGEAH